MKDHQGRVWRNIQIDSVMKFEYVAMYSMCCRRQTPLSKTVFIAQHDACTDATGPVSESRSQMLHAPLMSKTVERRQSEVKFIHVKPRSVPGHSTGPMREELALTRSPASQSEAKSIPVTPKVSCSID